jgi:hypothetical protein
MMNNADLSIKQTLTDIRGEDATIAANISSKFLVAVSSRNHYTTRHQTYGGGFEERCSHAECAGRLAENDAAYAAIPVTVQIGDPAINFAAGADRNHIAVPKGVGNADSWYFQHSFPPYVIFCRLKNPAGLPEHTVADGCNQHADEHHTHVNHIRDIPGNKP